MFVDGTNLFSSNENIMTLFSTTNKKITKIQEWFNKLNVSKTKYSFFQVGN